MTGANRRCAGDRWPYWVELDGKPGHYPWTYFRLATTEEIATVLRKVQKKPAKTLPVQFVLENGWTLSITTAMTNAACNVTAWPTVNKIAKTDDHFRFRSGKQDVDCYSLKEMLAAVVEVHDAQALIEAIRAPKREERKPPPSSFEQISAAQQRREPEDGL